MGLFSRLREWVLSLFGGGPTESVLRARVLCSPFKFDFDSAVKKAFAPMEVKADDAEFQAQVRKHRDELLAKVQAFYADAKMHAWFKFLVEQNQSIQYNMVIDSQELQTKLYEGMLAQAEQNFVQSRLFEARQAETGQRLRTLKESLALALCHTDEGVCHDLRNADALAESRPSLDKEYTKLLTGLENALSVADRVVEEIPREVTRVFASNLNQLLQKGVSPAVTKAVSSSKLNNVVGFLKHESVVRFERMYDLSYSIKLLPVFVKHFFYTLFEFLNLDNYSDAQKSLLI